MRLLYIRLWVVALCCLPVVSMAQGDTTYCDKYGRKVNKKKHAAFYCTWIEDENGRYREECYFMDGAKKSLKQYKADRITEDGKFISWYEKGKVSFEGSFINGKRYGEHKTYYDSGQIWESEYYTQNALDGELKSYYPDGKTKRNAAYIHGEAVKAEMYDTAGNLIPFTPFRKMPAPGYNLGQYLSSIIRYPDKARKNNITGRVEIIFVIDKEGNVTRPAIRRSVDKLLDDEALRVVSQMPKWQPGMEDDKPTEVYFTLPVNFNIN